MTQELSTLEAAAPVDAARLRQIDDLALASLLSSRICHDLVSPVGALHSGLEIIEDGADADFHNHAMRVVFQGARETKARLEFYRAAFGAGSGFADDANVDELRTLVAAFLDGGRLSLEWEEGEQAIDRVAARLFLNLILIGVESLPRGGLLRAGAMRQDSLSLIVIAEGPSTKFGPRVRSLLRHGALDIDEAPLEPKEAPILLTHRLAKERGAELSYGEDKGRVVLAATL